MMVIIFNIGNINYSPIAIEVLKHYFIKHGIRHKIVTTLGEYNYNNVHPSWMKMLAHKMFPGNDFILTWDLDLLPIDSSLNIEAVIDKSRLNMVYDTSVVLGYEVYTPKTFKYNGGLIGIPNHLSDWCANIYDKYSLGEYPSYEQYYLNERIVFDKIDVNRLPDEMNVLYPKLDDGWDIWNRAIFKHYSFGGIKNPPSMVETLTKHRDEYFRSE